MIKLFTAASVLLILALPVSAQVGRTVKARLVFFQEAADNPSAFYHAAADGEFVKVTPTAGVGDAVAEMPLDAAGQISFLRAPAPGSPAAVAKVPDGVTEAVFFLLKAPAATATSPAFRVLVADDSLKSLPRGGSFVCNIGGFGARMALGESKYVLQPGKPAYVKRPDTRDAYNMAAFQVEAQDRDIWKPLKDTMMRFSENERYFIFVFADTGGVPAVKIYKQLIPLKQPESAAR